MKFLLDTHVLFWTLTLQKTKLSKKVTKTLEEADELILPTIVLLELSGLLQKKQGDRYFDILLNQIPKSKYFIVPLDLRTVEETRRIKGTLELHDKVIVATAKILDIPIITKDKEIAKVYKKIIW